MNRPWITESLPPLVGVPEAVEILGVNQATLYRWINSGYILPPRRIAAGPLWAREDIERFAVEVGRQRAPKRSRRP